MERVGGEMEGLGTSGGGEREGNVAMAEIKPTECRRSYYIRDLKLSVRVCVYSWGFR